jgi:hypothetical protein
MKKLFMIAAVAGAILSSSILLAVPLSIHWLYSKSPTLLELEDRSTWEIPSSDSSTLNAWMDDAPLLIVPNNSSWFGNPYYEHFIKNTKDDTFVRARLKDGPERQGPYSHWLTEVNFQGFLSLDNKTQWEIDPRDRYILSTKNWSPGDTIVLVLQEKRYSYYYGTCFDYIFFNVSRDSNIRVKQC